MKLLHNLQNHSLFERTTKFQQGKVVPSDKRIYILQKSNTVFQLPVLSSGIVLKIKTEEITVHKIFGY